jgi:HPt (histidine-containing phosphotransfer) domain-containing protein
MQKQKTGLVFFIVIILLIYTLGNLQGVIYEIKKSSLDIIYLDKNDFREIDNPELTIQNRQLTKDDRHSYTYVLPFNNSLFENRLTEGRAPTRPNWYLLIEKPDANYFEVQLNNQIIGKRGQLSGNANLWNGFFALEFNEGYLNDQNKLSIIMKSGYMTGVAGNILILSEEDYMSLKYFMSIDEVIIMASSVIAFFAALILVLFIISLRKKIYNILTYNYFVISIVTMGISMLDYQIIEHMPLDYLVYKKIVILSYHLSITFVILAVSYLVNTRVKFNLGMIGTVIIAVSALFVTDALDFRKIYIWANYGILLAVLQMIIILIRYRKRTPMSASLLLFGFGLSAITVVKLVLVTSNVFHANTYNDMAILIIIFVVLVLFTLFLELINLSQDGVVINEKSQEMLKYQSLSGNFSVDRKLQAIAPYSMACDHIFKRFILGESLVALFFPNDEQSQKFFNDTLELFFNPEYEFKDGIIALLPSEITIANRIYFVSYTPYQKEQLFLGVNLSDITQMKALESQLISNQQEMHLIINALKQKEELSYIINKTRESITHLKNNELDEYFAHELHTIKGNLGQFGFKHLEQVIHEIESDLKTQGYEQKSLLTKLEVALENELNHLYKYIGNDYFKEVDERYEITETKLCHIEKNFKKLVDAIDRDNVEQYRQLVFQSMQEVRFISFMSMFKRFDTLIQQMSKNLEKNCLPYEIIGQDIDVRRVLAEPFLQVAVSIIRNSMCHGIEKSDVRVQRGKDSFGRLQCVFKRCGKDLERIGIEFIDDGQGIDLEYLKSKALQNNEIASAEFSSYSEEELLELIFVKDISMTEEVDLYSGRGIGLSAVKEYVESIGGIVRVRTIRHQMTSILVELPISQLQGNSCLNPF